MQISGLLKPADQRYWPGAIIIVLGICAYANSFRGVYFPDDYRSIPGAAPAPIYTPHKGQTAVAFSHKVEPESLFHDLRLDSKYYTRPVIALTLAFNYVFSKTDIWSYHLVNLIVHLLAALTLFGIVRRTLASAALEKHFEPAAAPWLALLCALLWLAHPLQTEAVTYIMQRAEELMGLFYLLVIYCLIRGATAEKNTLWLWAGVAASLLGMGAKPVMVTVPVAAFLYDRAFLAGSCAAAWGQRWRFYEKLLLTAALGLVLAFLAPTSPSVGFNQSQLHQSLDYVQSQFGVILYYLRLALWPNALCLDYWWPADTQLALTQRIALFLAAGALVAATVWASINKPALGFLGVWFFLLLAPTSSFIPLANKAVEHRLYLPLAAVVAGVVLGGYSLARYIRQHAGFTERACAQLKFFGYEAAVLVAVTLTMLTIQRNRDYANPIDMWRDTVKKAPENPRAYDNLGLAYYREKKSALAEAAFGEALRKDNSYWPASVNLGALHEARGNLAQAIAYYAGALRYNNDPQLRRSTAVLCDTYGRELLNKKPSAAKEAEDQFRSATSYDSQYEPPFFSLGLLLAEKKDFSGAVAAFSASNSLIPGRIAVTQQLGRAYYGIGAYQASIGKWDTAITYYVQSLQFFPDYAPTVNAMAEALVQRKRLDKEQAVFTKALEQPLENWRKNPADVTACNDIAYWDNGLGLFLRERDKITEAVAAFEQVLKAKPDYWQAHFNLALALQPLGKISEAAEHYKETLRLNPNFAPAKTNLANILNDVFGLEKMAHAQYAEAEAYFREACKVEPAYWPAWFNLGKVLQIQNKPAEALSAYKEALRLNPNSGEASYQINVISGSLK